MFTTAGGLQQIDLRKLTTAGRLQYLDYDSVTKGGGLQEVDLLAYYSRLTTAD